MGPIDRSSVDQIIEEDAEVLRGLAESEARDRSHNPMGVEAGQLWTHHRADGRHTDYVVRRLKGRNKATFFADHGSFTEMAEVFLDRMTPEEWVRRG